MKKSQLLKEAKRLLTDNVHSYVCVAIVMAADSSKDQQAQAVSDTLCNTIHNNLKKRTIIGYIRDTYPILPIMSGNQLFDMRIRWIDELIEYYQQQGD